MRCRLWFSGFADKAKGFLPGLVVGLLLLPAVGARAEVTADPNAAAASRPRVDAAPNGVPLVQITAPSGAGVSRNQYQTYSVDPQGVILNNSATLSQTQQAGWVQGNPNFSSGQSARVILNEVTSANPSLLRGYTEVAGNRADVVIANPNGITCNGCGFINTSRGVLTTGRPEFDGSGNLAAFNVTGGNIALEGLGLNASNIDQVDLLARTVSVNAEVWANYLNVITGANRVDYVSLAAQPVAGSGAAPQVSLDVSALGGMYANRIRLVGTENGVGVRNLGIIASAGELTLSANGILDNSALITAGGPLSISTQGVNNDGAAAVIASAGNISIDAGRQLNNTAGATIYTLSNLDLTAAGVLNESSTIEAEGNLTLTADQVVNRRTVLQIDTTTNTSSYSESISPPGGYVDARLDYTSTVTEQSLSPSTTAEAKILSGGDMRLNIGTSLFNDSSTVAAGGNLTFTNPFATITNQAPTLTRTTTDSGTYVYGRMETYCARRIRFPGGSFCANWDTRRVEDSVPYYQQAVDTLAGPTATISANQTINGVAMTLENFSVAPAAVGNTGQVPPSGNSNPPTGMLPLPQGGLYQLHTEPSYPYLYETDPRFRSYGNFLSSSYLLDQLGIAPGETLKRLGDGFYEQKLVQDEVMQLTGRRFLENYASNETEFKALMDAGVAVAQEFSLRPGMTLSAEQVASLTHDVVWLEERIVRGQKVWAPVVYLARTRANDLDSFGAIIAADTVNLKLAGDLSNSGVIRATSYSDIEANNILNQGGSIQGGQYSYLNAKNDIVNQSGTITSDKLNLDAGRDIRSETLAHEIQRNAPTSAASAGGKGALVAADGNGEQSVTFVQQQATIAGSQQLTINAGRDVSFMGANVKSGGALTLDAGRDITADAVRRSERVAVVFGKGFFERESTSHLATAITSGGDTRLAAGNDITLTGARVESGAGVTLQAGGDIRLAAVKDRELLDTNVSYGLAGSRRDREDRETVRGTEINAHGDIAVTASGKTETHSLDNARVTDDTQSKTTKPSPEHPEPASGAIVLEGSTIVSESGAVTVRGGDITVASVSERHESLQEIEKSTHKITSTKSSYSRDRVLEERAVGAEISGGTVSVEASREVSITGSTVVANGNVTLAAQGNVHIAAAEETLVEEHVREEKRSGLSTKSNGFTIGKSRATSTEDITASTASAATVGSVDGTVSIHASKDVAIQGSDLIAGSDINVTGQQVSVETATQTRHTRETQETKQSGMTVAVVGTPTDTYKNLKEAGDRKGFAKVRGTIDEIAASSATTTQVATTFSKSQSSSSFTTDALTHRNSSLTAGGDIHLTATGASTPIGDTDAKNQASGGDINVIGSTLKAGGLAELDAARDITVQASTDQYRETREANSHATSFSTAVASVGDSTRHITGGPNNGGVRSSPYNSIKGSDSANSQASIQTASLIDANSVALNSQRGDIRLVGSGVIADQDIDLHAAQGKIDIQSGQNSQSHQEEHSGKQLGDLGSNAQGGSSGTSNTVGVRNKHNTLDTALNEQSTIRSAIDSHSGNVTLTAHDDLTVQGADLTAAKDLTLIGKDVVLDPGQDNAHTQQATQMKQVGVTASLSGYAVDAAKALENAANAAEHKDGETGDDKQHDNRMAALYAAKAGLTLYNGVSGNSNSGAAPSTPPSNSGSAAVKLTVSIGSNSAQSESENATTQHQVSQLTAGQTVHITATGSGEHDAEGKAVDGDITASGTRIKGSDVTLTAARDITLQSVQDTSLDHSSNTSHSASVGVGFGVGGEQNGFTIELAAGGARGKADGDSTFQQNTQVTARNTLTLNSGNDTNLKGAQVSGNYVLANVQGNLNIESRQDIENYVSRQNDVGFSLSLCIPPICYGTTASATVSEASANIHSTYKSVRDQSGIYAGNGGYDITVGKNTDLKGAVIASQAEASKNNLTTATLTTSDIENIAEFRSDSSSLSFSYSGGNSGEGGMTAPGDKIPNTTNTASGGGMQTLSNNLTANALGNAIPDDKGHARGTTKSAIGAGTITLTDDSKQKERTGHTATETIDSLNRDTDHANDGALQKIFDLKKVQQDREYQKLASEVAQQAAPIIYKQIGDLAKSQTKPYDEAQRQKLAAQNDLQQPGLDAPQREALQHTIAQADETLAQYQEQYTLWKEGGAYKIALHALAGAGLTAFTGGDAFKGALAGGVNEAQTVLIDALTKNLDADQQKFIHELASLATGTAIGGSQTGVFTLLADRNNRQLHISEQELLRKKAKQLAAADVRQNTNLETTETGELSQQVAYQLSGTNSQEEYWYRLLTAEAQAKVDYSFATQREAYLDKLAASVDGQYVGNEFVPDYFRDVLTAKTAIRQMEGQAILDRNGNQIVADGAALTTFQTNNVVQYTDHRLFGAGTSGLEMREQFGSYEAARVAQASESGRSNAQTQTAIERGDAAREQRAFTRNGAAVPDTSIDEVILALGTGPAGALRGAAGRLMGRLTTKAESEAVVAAAQNRALAGVDDVAVAARKAVEPVDPYDVAAWQKYYEANPGAARSAGAAAGDRGSSRIPNLETQGTPAQPGVPEARLAFDPSHHPTRVRAELYDGIVDFTDINSAALGKGQGADLLAQAARDLRIQFEKEFRFSAITNEPTLQAWQTGVNAADSVLGRTGIQAAEKLGLEVTNVRFETYRYGTKLRMIFELKQ